MKRAASTTLAINVYDRIKAEIFDFALLPGDRFTENEVADRVGVSRTPVREALYRLEREGYIAVSARNGWNVKPFDFTAFENLYDVRVILELAAVRKLCATGGTRALAEFNVTWCVAPPARERDPARVCEMDEAFHSGLITATANGEMARIHRDVSERIRIIRRLDFTQADRIGHTYDEHARILLALMDRNADHAAMLLTSHIEASKAVVRQITLHRLHTARSDMAMEKERRQA